jgi:hypothetical protein
MKLIFQDRIYVYVFQPNILRFMNTIRVCLDFKYEDRYTIRVCACLDFMHQPNGTCKVLAIYDIDRVHTYICTTTWYKSFICYIRGVCVYTWVKLRPRVYVRVHVGVASAAPSS